MSIKYLDEFKSFYLSTPNTSYVFHINDGGFLIHDYYGKKIAECDMRYFSARPGRSSFSPRSADFTTTPDSAPMEYSVNGTGDYRVSALQIREFRGNASTDIRFDSYKIYSGKPALKGQPATYGTEKETTTLEIVAKDAVTNAEVTLYYTVFENYDAIARRVKVTNASENGMDLERVYSSCTELPKGNWDICHLYGMWGRERKFERNHISRGITAIESKRGASGHHHNPFIRNR